MNINRRSAARHDWSRLLGLRARCLGSSWTFPFVPASNAKAPWRRRSVKVEASIIRACAIRRQTDARAAPFWSLSPGSDHFARRSLNLCDDSECLDSLSRAIVRPETNQFSVKTWWFALSQLYNHDLRTGGAAVSRLRIIRNAHKASWRARAGAKSPELALLKMDVLGVYTRPERPMGTYADGPSSSEVVCALVGRVQHRTSERAARVHREQLNHGYDGVDRDGRFARRC